MVHLYAKQSKDDGARCSIIDYKAAANYSKPIGGEN